MAQYHMFKKNCWSNYKFDDFVAPPPPPRPPHLLEYALTRITELVSSSSKVFLDVAGLAIDLKVWSLHHWRLVQGVRALATCEALLVVPFIATHHFFGFKHLIIIEKRVSFKIIYYCCYWCSRSPLPHGGGVDDPKRLSYQLTSSKVNTFCIR